MFYVFIFESVGASELILIGAVALILFGPRKLPEIARTIGKTMAEFRRSTDEFKKTWQQELELEEAKKSFEALAADANEIKSDATVSRQPSVNEAENVTVATPQIVEISDNDFGKKFAKENIKTATVAEVVRNTSEKQDWL